MCMKNVILIVLISAGLLSTSCYKIKINPNDYRNNLVGKYQATGTIDCYGPCGDCHKEWDSVITINYGSTDSTLYIWGEDIYFSEKETSYGFGLRLWNDSIFYSMKNGGLGCGQFEYFTGSKIADLY